MASFKSGEAVARLIVVMRSWFLFQTVFLGIFCENLATWTLGMGNGHFMCFIQCSSPKNVVICENIHLFRVLGTHGRGEQTCGC